MHVFKWETWIINGINDKVGIIDNLIIITKYYDVNVLGEQSIVYWNIYWNGDRDSYIDVVCVVCQLYWF